MIGTHTYALRHRHSIARKSAVSRNGFFPDGEQYLDWSLLIERRLFLYLSISACSLFFLALLRTILAFVGDHYLHVPRFHLLTNLRQATVAFFKMPENK